MELDSLNLYLRLINDQTESNLLLLQNLLNGTEDVTPIICTLFEQQHVRVAGFAEVWIGNYMDYDFFRLFGMCKSTFINLNGKINGLVHFNEDYTGGRGIPLSKI